jgi:hypothetical protein
MPYEDNYDSLYDSSYDYTLYDMGFIFNNDDEEEEATESYDA